MKTKEQKIVEREYALCAEFDCIVSELISRNEALEKSYEKSEKMEHNKVELKNNLTKLANQILKRIAKWEKREKKVKQALNNNNLKLIPEVSGILPVISMLKKDLAQVQESDNLSFLPEKNNFFRMHTAVETATNWKFSKKPESRQMLIMREAYKKEESSRKIKKVAVLASLAIGGTALSVSQSEIIKENVENARGFAEEQFENISNLPGLIKSQVFKEKKEKLSEIETSRMELLAAKKILSTQANIMNQTYEEQPLILTRHL